MSDGDTLDPSVFRQAMAASRDGMAILNDDGEYEYVNQRHAEIYGYDSPDAFLGETWRQCYEDEEVRRFERDVMPTLEAEGEWHGEAVGKRKDGTPFPHQLSLTIIDGGRLVCVIRDVRERKAREQTFQERTERLEMIVDNLPLILFTIDKDGILRRSEGKGLEALGLEPGEVVGENVYDIYSSNTGVIEDCRRALAGEQVQSTRELEGQFFETLYQPVFADGEVERVVGVAQDVTERKRQENQLQTLHEGAQELMYAHSSEEIAELTVEITEDVLNHPITAMWSFDPEADALVPKAWTDGAAERSAQDGTPGPSTIQDGTIEMEIFRDGELTVIEDYQQSETAIEDVPLRTLVLVPIGEHGLLNVGSDRVRDVSPSERYLLTILGQTARAALDRAEREQELEEHTEQMEFLNALLRHDILNGMMVIRSRAEYLQEQVDREYRTQIETILRWSDDSVDLIEKVRSVLNTLSGESQELERRELCQVLRQEIERIRATYPAVSVTVDAPERQPVLADEMLSEVFSNVLLNAVKHNDADAPEIEVTVRDGDPITVRIADNGPGIDPEYRDSIFRRNYNGIHEDDGAGSGFGLYFVDVMVDKYGGDVWVEDNDSEGAVFVFELPKP